MLGRAKGRHFLVFRGEKNIILDAQGESSE